MELNDYQEMAKLTDTSRKLGPTYYILGLAGEAGEVAEKYKKIMRNDNGHISDERRLLLAYELGDALWYLSAISDILGFSLEEIAQLNIDKLTDRAQRGVINSEGDIR